MGTQAVLHQRFIVGAAAIADCGQGWFQGAGDIANVVGAYKSALGSTDGSNTGGQPVNFEDGFRQINWDPPPTVPFSDDKQALFPGGTCPHHAAVVRR